MDRACVSLLGALLVVAGSALFPAQGFPDSSTDPGTWQGPERLGPSVQVSTSGHVSPAAHKLGIFFADGVNPTPEPVALLLFGAALAGLGLLVRRRRRRSTAVARE